MRLTSKLGGFEFIHGGFPYSAGVVAAPRHEIEHARFRRPLALAEGFRAVGEHLTAKGRPKQALCAMELRSPRPFSFDGFRQFNAGYVEVLKEWDLLVDGNNPVARTNVAPEVGPPDVPSIYAFSYTMPAREAPPSFVVAGGGEWPDGATKPEEVIRTGDTSPDAMKEKARFVLGLMEKRLHDLGVSWREAASTCMYTVHDLHSWIGSELLVRMGPAGGHGLTWHYSRPPIVTIEFEMDVRGVRRELVLG